MAGLTTICNFYGSYFCDVLSIGMEQSEICSTSALDALILLDKLLRLRWFVCVCAHVAGVVREKERE